MTEEPEPMWLTMLRTADLPFNAPTYAFLLKSGAVVWGTNPVPPSPEALPLGAVRRAPDGEIVFIEHAPRPL